MAKKFLSLLVFVLLISPLAFTQSRETGAITGTVRDEAGGPLPGVTVTISGPSLMGNRTYVTDARGIYRFPALPPGNYNLKAELQGFTTVVNENIRLSTTTTLTIDIAMKQAALAEEERPDMLCPSATRSAASSRFPCRLPVI